MLERAETTAGRRSDPEPGSAEIVKARHRERTRQLKLIAGIVLLAAIVIGSMVLNDAYKR